MAQLQHGHPPPLLHDIERLEALSTLGQLVAGAAHDLRDRKSVV